MKEYFLKIVNGDPAEVVQQLKEKGIKVLHRSGNTLAVESNTAPKLTSDLSKFVRTTNVEPLTEIPEEASDEDIPLLALQLRQTKDFQRSKETQSTEDEDWGKIFETL